MLRHLLCIGALMALGGGVEAQPPSLHQVVDDVVLDVSLSPEGLTGCLSTIGGAKLSAQHGVVINALSGPSVWDESLPKTVTDEADYFKLPLRVELKRRHGAAGSGRVQFAVGACLSEGICIPVEIAVDAGVVGSKTIPCSG